MTSSTANGTYGVGPVIPVQVTFSEPVTVTGTPQLTLATGSPATTAVNYACGTGTSTLTFNYTVAAGNASVPRLRVDGRAGPQRRHDQRRRHQRRDADAGRARRAGSLSANKNIVIDTSPPTVTNVTSTQPTAPTAGTIIPIKVTFSEPVTVTGTPQLTLATGTPASTANYASGTGTSTLTFNYTVARATTRRTSTTRDQLAHAQRRHDQGHPRQRGRPHACDAGYGRVAQPRAATW